METAERVKQILVDQLCVKPSEVKLEEELQIELPDEDAEKLTTVNDVILYCEAKTA